MDRQLIISISREFGSGGHVIATEVADRLDLKLYDHNLLDHIAEEMEVDGSQLKKYDEKPRIHLTSRRVKGMSSSPEEHVAQMQFEYIRKKAEEGESFVLVGRCGESVLKGNENLITIFILGDEKSKVRRVMERFDLDEREARLKIRRHDIYRKRYHNSYSQYRWGDSRGYDLCINSTRLGVEATIEEILSYIVRRREDLACKLA